MGQKLAKFDKEKTQAMQREIDAYRTTDKENRHNDQGHEILNPTPMQPPLGYNPQPSLAEQIRRSLRQLKDEDMEPETLEEADDFEIDDDPPIPSRWENDNIPSIKEIGLRNKELEKQAKLLSQTAQKGRSAGPQPSQDAEPDTPEE